MNAFSWKVACLVIVGVWGVAPVAATCMTGAPMIWADEPWTGWLGPRRDGKVADFRLPANWPQELSLRWKVDVGEGYGSPLIVQDRIYQHARQGPDEVLWCLNLADGKTIWKRSWPVPFKPGGGGEWHGVGPKSNPVFADGRVFTLSIDGVLNAWSAETGENLWRRDQRLRFTTNHPYWGVSASPLVDQQRLIIHLGNDDEGALMALDVESGEPVWEQGREGTSYSSPLVTDIEGVRQVVQWNHQMVVGVDIETGKRLWQFPLAHDGSNQNMPTPTIHDGCVIVGAENRGIRSLKPVRGESGWNVTEKWFVDELALDMSTAVINDGLLYGFSHYDRGRLFCMDPRDGSVRWLGPPRAGSNVMFLSLPGHVAALMDGGQLKILRASGQGLQAAASYQVSERPTWAGPVLRNDGWFIKDRESLLRWTW